MTKQIIETGSLANDGTGDTLRTGAQKINANFTELYNSIYSLPTAGVGSAGVLGGVKVDGTSVVINNGVISSAGTTGPASTTDNAITRFDGTTGRLLQNSVVTISDSGAIVAPVASSVIPFHYENQTEFPSAVTYHGAIAHSHADGKMYFAHSGAWIALASAIDVPAAYSVTSINALSDVNTSSVVPTNGQVLAWQASTSQWIPTSAVSTAGGTVTSTTVASANGFAGTVATATSTPAITISTSITGVLKGNGTAISAATSGTTASLANNVAGNITITGWKSYMLLSIQTSAAAWVTVYTSSAARTSDASRTITTDPTPGSGVIAEVITTSASTQIFSPAVFGFSDESSPSIAIQLKVVNKSGSATAIIVAMKLVRLEA